jgi:MmyB-like transcription regulator ligand binding domain
MLDRLGREAVPSGDPALLALHEELAAYPGGERGHGADLEAGAIATLLCLRARRRALVHQHGDPLGTATDVTVAELRIESFFPADDVTARALGDRGGGQPAAGS